MRCIGFGGEGCGCEDNLGVSIVYKIHIRSLYSYPVLKFQRHWGTLDAISLSLTMTSISCVIGVITLTQYSFPWCKLNPHGIPHQNNVLSCKQLDVLSKAILSVTQLFFF